MAHGLNFLRRFGASTSGNTAIIFTVAAVPLLGMAGVAFDYSRWNYQQSRMQNVADAAALAGVNSYLTNLYAKKKSKTTAESIALATVNKYIAAQYATESHTVQVVFTESPPTVDVNLEGKGVATLTKLIGTQDPVISAKAVAVASKSTTAACVIGLKPTATPGVSFQLSGSFLAKDCAVWSNSTQGPSLNGGNAGSATATRFCAAGTVSGGSMVFSVAPEENCDPVEDPLADVNMPSVGLCDYTNFTSSVSGPVTLLPGVYCGGLKFSSQVEIQLSPGNYIVKDGAFTMVGGSSVTGTGITFFLTGSNSGLSLGGAATISITAPTSGEYAGIAIFSDRNSPVDTSKLIGSSSLDIEGVIYLPNHDLTFSGSNSALMPANYTVLIARTISFQGSSDTVIRSDFGASNVPVPEKILQTRLYPRLTK